MCVRETRAPPGAGGPLPGVFPGWPGPRPRRVSGPGGVSGPSDATRRGRAADPPAPLPAQSPPQALGLAVAARGLAGPAQELRPAGGEVGPFAVGADGRPNQPHGALGGFGGVCPWAVGKGKGGRFVGGGGRGLFGSQLDLTFVPWQGLGATIPGGGGLGPRPSPLVQVSRRVLAAAGDSWRKWARCFPRGGTLPGGAPQAAPLALARCPPGGVPRPGAIPFGPAGRLGAALGRRAPALARFLPGWAGGHAKWLTESLVVGLVVCRAIGLVGGLPAWAAISPWPARPFRELPKNR
jgi:hypothetical protein